MPDDAAYYTAAAHPGGFYTYTKQGLFTGIAVSPGIGFRFAPEGVRDVIRTDSKARRTRDRKVHAMPCDVCKKPNPNYPASGVCSRKRCENR